MRFPSQEKSLFKIQNFSSISKGLDVSLKRSQIIMKQYLFTHFTKVTMKVLKANIKGHIIVSKTLVLTIEEIQFA